MSEKKDPTVSSQQEKEKKVNNLKLNIVKKHIRKINIKIILKGIYLMDICLSYLWSRLFFTINSVIDGKDIISFYPPFIINVSLRF